MPQPLDVLLSRLDTAVQSADDRRASYESTRDRACTLARRLPLVHRTGNKKDWQTIFKTHRLTADKVPTEHEQRAGRARSVYFFLGAGAFPHGHVALLLSPGSVLDDADAATFSPYDSGGMEYCVPDARDIDAMCKHFQEHAGDAHDVQNFAGPYLAGHFRDPLKYVSASQESSPDFPPFHGLVSRTNDRRAWTIEIQCHDDVVISPDVRVLSALLVVGAHKLFELPDEYIDRASVVPDDSTSDILYSAVGEHIAGGAF